MAQETAHKLDDVESLGSTRDRRISVVTDSHFAAKVSLVAKCDLPVDATYDLLVHDDAWKIFRDIKRLGFRQTIKDAHGIKEEVVEHISGWRFLFMSGEFSTRLRVVQNRRQGTVHFRLISSDVMKDFEGCWTVKPFTQHAMDELYGRSAVGPLAAFERFTDFLKPKQSASLLRLEQYIQPKTVPRPLLGLIRKLAANQVKRLMEDLDREILLVSQGKATIETLNKYKSSSPSADGARQLASISAAALCGARGFNTAPLALTFI